MTTSAPSAGLSVEEIKVAFGSSLDQARNGRLRLWLVSDCGERASINQHRQREHFVSLTRQPQPPALIQNEPSCYHFRAFDPRVFAIHCATRAAVTIGSSSDI